MTRGVKRRDSNLWAALSHAVGPIGGVIVLWVEKSDSYVRFHAWQSVLTFSAVAAIKMLLPTVPVVGHWGITGVIFWLSLVALYVFLIVKALQGERYKLPLVAISPPICRRSVAGSTIRPPKTARSWAWVSRPSL